MRRSNLLKPIPISFAQAGQIKGMHQRGDRQMDIATFFGINQARVNEIVNHSGRWGRHFRDVTIPPPHLLPEPGPYKVVGLHGYMALQTAAAVPTELLEALLRDVRDIKEKIGLSHAAG